MSYIIAGGFFYLGMLGISMLIPVQHKSVGGGGSSPSVPYVWTQPWLGF